MKHFLSVFFLFVILFLSIPGQAISPWDTFSDEIRQTLAHSNGGVTPWQNTDKIKARLVSCQTGIRDTTNLLAGIEIITDSDWQLNEPHFDIAIKGHYVATPLPQFNLSLPIDQSWTQKYPNHMFFPILLEGTPDSDIELSVSGNLIIHHINDSSLPPITQQISLTLPLSVQEAYPSNVCGALKFALKTAALDIQKTKIQFENQLLNNGDIRLRLTFPKSIQSVEIQGRDNLKVTSVMSEINKNRYSVVLRPDQPLNPGDNLPLNIRSSAGCYTLNLTISNTPLPPVETDISYWIAFWAGLLFFLSSPVWCFWLAPIKLSHTNKNFRHQVRLLQLSILCGIVGLLILWLLEFEPNLWIGQPIALIIFFLICLYFLIRPFPPIWMIGILIFILPKPFWGMIENLSDTAKIGVAVWWCVCCCLPFNLWLLNEKNVLKIFKQFQLDNISSYQQIIRLPYWILCG
ncbi:MAG: hypothetical protein IJV07_00660, partial [Alphaproteobacteria bacterium]|nr:hypothetical protein [Alphaproteobacteria bacterium]